MGNDISLVKSSYVLSIFNTKINQLIQALIIQALPNRLICSGTIDQIKNMKNRNNKK